MTLKPRPRRWLATVACTLLLATAGCADSGDQPLVTSTSTNPGAPRVVPPTPPPGLLAQVRVASGPRVTSEVAAVGRRLGLWKLDAKELWPLIQQLLGAASDLTHIVDWRRPVHVLILDPAVDPGTVAFILPARHPDRALGRLAARCRARRQSAHWIFTGGGQGLLPCRFAARTLEGGLLVAPRLATLKRLWRFALITAAQDPGGGPALQARVFARAGLKKLGFTAKKLDQLAKVGALGLALATGDIAAADRIEAQLTRLFAYARSARDFGLTVHLGGEEVRLRFFVTARPRGALRRYIQTRRPGRLPALTPLPPRSPVALSVAAPRSIDPNAKPPAPGPGVILTALLTQLPADLRTPLARLVTRLLGDQGASRLALEPLDTGGFCLVGLVDHAHPTQLAGDLHKDLTQTLDGLRKHLQGRGFGDKAFKSKRAQAANLQVQSIHLAGKWPGGSAGLQLALKWLAGGDTLRLATAAHKGRLVVAFGAGAENQARATLGRLQGRAGKPGPGPVLPAGRLGRLRVSLVELVRAVPVLGVGVNLPKGDTGAIDLHWGVSPTHGQLDATVHLPLAHLVASAPLWQWLIDKLQAQGKALTSLTPVSGPEPEDAL